MSARAATAIALAFALASGPARADEPEGWSSRRLALVVEGAVSDGRVEGGGLLYGPRLRLRLGPAVFGASVELARTRAAHEPRPGALVLAGWGVLRELSPRAGAYGQLLVGWTSVHLRDYVDGGRRAVYGPAAGARAGVEWRVHAGWLGALGFAPLAGVSATVVYAEPRSDRLRGIAWGGLTALASLSLGGELAAPSREPRPAPPVSPPDRAQPGPPPAPRPARATLELAFPVTGLGSAPEIGGGLRVTVAPTARTVLSAGYDAGAGRAPNDGYLIATAGAGVRALRRGFMVEALAVGGLHRVDLLERDGIAEETHELPAFGARIGIARAPRRGGVSFLYGAAAELLGTPRRSSRHPEVSVGGAVAIFSASIGVSI